MEHEAQVSAYRTAHLLALADDFMDGKLDLDTYGATVDLIHDAFQKGIEPQTFELRRAEYYHKLRSDREAAEISKRIEKKEISFLRKIKQALWL